MNPIRMPILRQAVWVVLAIAVGTSSVRAETPAPVVGPVSQDLPAIFRKPTPESPKDLKDIQDQTRKVVDQVRPCTVGLAIGSSMGSGVIISEDGYILTAAHVIGEAGKDVVIFLPDGTRAKGKSLGLNSDIDSGMVKITEPDKQWPFAQLGDSGALKKGEWCVAIGHPGGYKSSRSPVVRVGRILSVSEKVVQSDCTLVGGDSGGPLFDMHGRVIGIHSRIGPLIHYNYHVPVNTYRDTWSRLLASEAWGGGWFGKAKTPKKPAPDAPTPAPTENAPFYGLVLDPDSEAPVVVQVLPKSPAEKAGVKVDDRILSFDRKPFGKRDDLIPALQTKSPGEVVILEVKRGNETIKLRITVGTRENQ
ncbi:S1C family serine protease [Tuwongella immobilis]|uniref:PDZ domain-containing protein n=1 Tax=Tuwongella immobilis TaxID=692036 RepID=A0A6C2YLL7_9BACT|nr:trypsin-like peptidase domain-containing protein [Tuwongella immobilis]VIP02274.1 serine protease : PDZ/DHR/GLGF domain protein OS=Pirellula staleyi (strain ATCC 27377 / DSM 6068 / ICPB 4128) GN=Psta_3927 PE=4 SV=1: Trypsin_2: PDZ_2 [Tuwongella immobilis]VTS00908.1 serine protease : PDZ/DHR/GLGF domain protein OS=Pirellula staleyi (strain ATCC 27377 / DSM 6068 / ICPB 4128) GN=Psta_3927 PE=4 SV=1: Trypsin_2: PDZ_2 [Tuwongella immobilis]